MLVLFPLVKLTGSVVTAPGAKQGQLDVIAGGQREVVVGLRVDDGIDLRCFGLEDRGSAGDFDSLADLADREFDIEASNLVFVKGRKWGYKEV